MLVVKVVVTFGIYSFVNCKLLPQQSESLRIKFKCLSTFLNSLSDNRVIVTNVPELKFHGGTLVRISNRTKSRCLRSLPEPYMYILDLRFITVDSTIEWLRDIHLFNPRAIFYLIIPDMIKVQVTKFFNNYIFKVVFVDIFGGRVYTWWNYNNSCMTTLHKFSEECDNIKAFIWNQKSEQFWKNKTVTVGLRIGAPFVTGQETGLEEMMFRYIQDWLKLNISFWYLPTEVIYLVLFYLFHTIFFMFQLTVPYAKTKQAILNRSVDIFGGHLVIISEDVRRFDFSPTYLFDSVRFVSPKPLNMSRWERLFKVYSLLFWILLLIACIISLFLTKICYHIGFQDSLLAFIAMYVGEAVKYLSTNVLSQKIIFTIWIFAFAILSKIFSNFLIVLSATTLKSHHLIETLDDVVKSGLPVYSIANLTTFYYLPTSSERAKLNLFERRHCNDYRTCLRSLIENQNFILVGGGEVFKFNYFPLMQAPKGEPVFHMSKERLNSFPLLFLFSKGHPLYKSFSKIFYISQENGWVQHKLKILTSLEKDYTQHQLECSPIFLKDLADLFAFWVIGTIISLVVFLVEVLYYYVRLYIQSKQYKVCACYFC